MTDAAQGVILTERKVGRPSVLLTTINRTERPSVRRCRSAGDGVGRVGFEADNDLQAAIIAGVGPTFSACRDLKARRNSRFHREARAAMGRLLTC
ncbi:hypothetical protein [Nocardia sp. SC052]|uniref:hypothetical protein n=1 Tax=Nocardia sichangensis TaxID=3385975 RepID=UPI0039A35172